MRLLDLAVVILSPQLVGQVFRLIGFSDLLGILGFLVLVVLVPRVIRPRLFRDDIVSPDMFPPFVTPARVDTAFTYLFPFLCVLEFKLWVRDFIGAGDRSFSLSIVVFLFAVFGILMWQAAPKGGGDTE